MNYSFANSKLDHLSPPHTIATMFLLPTRSLTASLRCLLSITPPRTILLVSSALPALLPLFPTRPHLLLLPPLLLLLKTLVPLLPQSPAPIGEAFETKLSKSICVPCESFTQPKVPRATLATTLHFILPLALSSGPSSLHMQKAYSLLIAASL